MKELTVKGAIIDIQTNIRASALHLAMQNGHTEAVKELIAKGANIEIKTNSGASALYLGSHKGYTQVKNYFMMYILSHYYKKNENFNRF